MQALILAAGFGFRLREVIHGQPKHMVAINGRPFLRHLVMMLVRRGIREIVFAVGYLPQSIKNEFKEYSFSEDDRPMGTAGSLKNAQKFFKSDFLMINGDTYLDIDYQRLMAWHLHQGQLISVVVNQNISCGVYAVSPKIFNLIPEGKKMSLEKDVLPKLKINRQLVYYPTNAAFIDIGSPEGYLQAMKKLI
jgi:NDP-sugar pyrophosphorylase family protein